MQLTNSKSSARGLLTFSLLALGGILARNFSSNQVSPPPSDNVNTSSYLEFQDTSSSQLTPQSGNFGVENIQGFGNQETYDSRKLGGYNPGSTVSSPSKPDDSTCNPMECGDSIYNSNPCSLGSVIEGAGTQRSYAGVSRTCTYTNNGQTFKLSPKCQGKCKVGYVWNGSECKKEENTRCSTTANTCSFGKVEDRSKKEGEKEAWECTIHVESGKTNERCTICKEGYEKNKDTNQCVKKKCDIGKGLIKGRESEGCQPDPGLTLKIKRRAKTNQGLKYAYFIKSNQNCKDDIRIDDGQIIQQEGGSTKEYKDNCSDKGKERKNKYCNDMYVSNYTTLILTGGMTSERKKKDHYDCLPCFDRSNGASILRGGVNQGMCSKGWLSSIEVNYPTRDEKKINFGRIDIPYLDKEGYWITEKIVDLGILEEVNNNVDNSITTYTCKAQASGAHCSDSNYTNQADCSNNGNTWYSNCSITGNSSCSQSNMGSKESCKAIEFSEKCDTYQKKDNGESASSQEFKRSCTATPYNPNEDTNANENGVKSGSCGGVWVSYPNNTSFSINPSIENGNSIIFSDRWGSEKCLFKMHCINGELSYNLSSGISDYSGEVSCTNISFTKIQ